MKGIHAFMTGVLLVDTFLLCYWCGLNSRHVKVVEGSDGNLPMHIAQVLPGPSQAPTIARPEPGKSEVTAGTSQQASGVKPTGTDGSGLKPAGTSAAPAGPPLFADFGDADERLQGGIATAVSLGIIKSDPKAKFDPNTPGTRGDFVLWLTRAREIEAAAPKTATFADVGTDSPYFKAVELANANKLVQGYETDGKKEFRPDKFISREEFAVLYGAFSDKRKRAEKLEKDQIEHYLFSDPASGTETRFTYRDVGEVDDWAYRWVAVAHQAGVLEQAFDVNPMAGDQQKRFLHPHQKMTRAEAINVLMQLYGTPEKHKKP